MDEDQWLGYMQLLAEGQETGVPSECVGCWYEGHGDGEAFPGDRVSSTLCEFHVEHLPPEVQPPYSL